MEKRKKELWETNKSLLQRFRINLSLRFMKFQRTTHGMGLFMLLILMIFVTFIVYDMIIRLIEGTESNNEKQKNAECLVSKGCLYPV